VGICISVRTQIGLYEGELNQPQTKAEPLQPSPKVCTFASGKEMLLSLRCS